MVSMPADASGLSSNAAQVAEVAEGARKAILAMDASIGRFTL